MIIADIHNHTQHFHGQSTVEEMYEAACKAGLQYFGLTEHSPLPKGFQCKLYTSENLKEAFDVYALEAMALKARTKSAAKRGECPHVLFGIEMDWLPNQPDFMEGLLAHYPFDLVIGSIHFLDTWNFGPKSNWENSTEEECFAHYGEYYQAMAALAESRMVDVIGHCDFIKLHSQEHFARWLQLPSSLNLVQNALTAMKDCGTAMEVSSGGLRKPCHEIHPAPPIMEMAAKMNIPITFGSDSHVTDTLCYAYDQLEAFARSYGYDNYLIFNQREPVRIMLD